MSRSNSADLTIMTTMSENEKLEVPEQELNQVGVKAFFGLDYESDNSSVNSLEEIHFQPVLEDTLLDKKIRTNTPTTKSRSSTPIQKSPTQSCSTPLLECIDMGRIKAMLGTNDSRRNSSITSLEDVTFLSEADRLADKKIRPITPISRSATPVLKSPTSCNTPLLQESLEAKECMMSSYERFDNDVSTNQNAKSEEVVRSDSNNLKDIHIQINQEPGSSQVTFHETDNKQNGMDYIDDPAGNPFMPKSTIEFLQYKVRGIVEHIAFRAVTVLLILLDFIIVLIVLSSDSCATSNNTLEIISHIIITLFVLEIAARIFYQGKEFFYNCFDLIDMVVVFVSFIVDMVFIGIETNKGCGEQGPNYAKLVVIGRVFRIIRIVRIIYFIIVQHRQVTRATRHVVSQNKRRYQRDGFDLDLCYITERVIAMSFPSKGVMALYRNPIREVARFFDAKHKDHYKLYNLCSERDYDEKLFHNRVERVYIDDHNVPRLRDMIKFADNVRQWMSADKRNIIAIHCKGGKGRTGTMICCWLVDSGLFEEAKESLNYFGDRRTDLSVGSTFQGVETPSQSRYVGYYEKMKNEHNRELPPNKKLRIKSVKIEGLKGVGNGDGSDLGMEIRPEGNLVWECQFGTNTNCQTMKYSDNDSIVVELQNSPVIEGDIKIMFRSTNKTIPLGYDKCPFYFWFYTSFIEDNRLYLARDEIDNPHKKKVQKIFKENFAIELKFEDVQEEEL